MTSPPELCPEDYARVAIVPSRMDKLDLHTFLGRMLRRAAHIGPRAWPVTLLFALTLLVPPAALAVFNYRHVREQLTRLAFARREALAEVAATTIKERLDRLVDVGKSLAGRQRFRQRVRDGDWEGAIRIMADVPQDFPYIERVFLADVNGTLQTDLPALPGVRGKRFDQRDWYQGVIRTWQPYVSNAYRRTAQPQYNVIAVAVPIRPRPDLVAGILVLQMRLETLQTWARQFRAGEGGVTYFTDAKGQVVAHPNVPPSGELLDFSAVPSVQAALAGRPGAAMSYNAIERTNRLAAYAPVPGYGWAVVVAQPPALAFAERDRALALLRWIYAIFLMGGAVMAVGLARFVIHSNAAELQIRELNASLEQQTRRLEVANQELEAFSYSVSHDLRAPLRAIDGFSRILEEDHGPRLEAEARRLLGVVRQGAQQMGRLIDDLLGFSRVGRQPMARGPVEMTRLAQAVAEDVKAQTDGRRVELTIGSLPSAEGDEALLRQVWVNLLSNAVKFTRGREVGRIEVSGQITPEGACYTVRDNGVGFDMQYLHKLFGVFQRLHRQEEFEGTGVGLALVQRIVHRHGGRVWAEGRVDEGATVSFVLPRGGR